MKTLLSSLGIGRILALLVCVFLAVLAYALKFLFRGYSFSALVCLCLIALILFYTFVPLLGMKYPVFTKWAIRYVTLFLCIGLLIVGITECFILKASFGDTRTQVDYMVVLGAKVRVTGPSASLWDRIYAAADYLNTHPNTIAVVSGGQGPDEPMTEAQSMQEELVKLGIAPERIWMEDQATSTWENLNFALDLIEDKTGQRPQQLGVLSSEYHLFRASLFTKACNVEFVGIPAPTSRVSQKINHFMREVAGVWHYLLLGGQYD